MCRYPSLMTFARALVAVVVLALAGGVAAWLLSDEPPPRVTPAVPAVPVAEEPEVEPEPEPLPVEEVAAEPPPIVAVPEVPARLVRGVVTRAADGTGVHGARVVVSVDGTRAASTTTDAAGRYDVAFEPSDGDVPRLDVSWSARGVEHEARRDLVAPVDADVVLDTGWTLDLRLVDPYGLPAKNAHAALVDADGDAVLVESDEIADGRWLVRDLPLATSTSTQWWIVVRAPYAAMAFQPAPRPFAPERHDVTVLLESAGAIDASIRTSDGRPAAGAVLDLPGSWLGDEMLEPPRSFTADAAGRARIDHVAPPATIVSGSWTDGRTGTTHRFHADVGIHPGQDSRWEYVISPGASLTGRVVTISGVARPGVLVDVTALVTPMSVPFDGEAVTDTNGAFSLAGLEPGEKWLRVFDDDELVAERTVELPPSGLDVVIAYGGRVDHAVYVLDPLGRPLAGSDVTLLATEAGVAPDLAQDWIGVTAGLPYDDPDGPLLEAEVVTGFQYVGNTPFRQSQVRYSRPLEAPPPGLTGPSTQTIEPPVDINLRAYFEPRLQPHARGADDGRVTVTLDANLTTIDVGGERLPSVPFGALSSTADVSVAAVLDDWIHGRVDLWAVASRAGWTTSAVRLEVATSTSPVVVLEPAPLLVVRVRDDFGSRRHEMHVEVVDPTTDARVVLDTEPLGPAAFVVFADRVGDGRQVEVVVDAPGHERATLPWTPREPATLDARDLVITRTKER